MPSDTEQQAGLQLVVDIAKGRLSLQESIEPIIESISSTLLDFNVVRKMPVIIEEYFKRLDTAASLAAERAARDLVRSLVETAKQLITARIVHGDNCVLVRYLVGLNTSTYSIPANTIGCTTIEKMLFLAASGIVEPVTLNKLEGERGEN